jgi:hypothetical protein
MRKQPDRRFRRTSKIWTEQDVWDLAFLEAQGMPTTLIGLKLGGTVAATYMRASQEGIDGFHCS